MFFAEVVAEFDGCVELDPADVPGVLELIVLPLVALLLLDELVPGVMGSVRTLFIALSQHFIVPDAAALDELDGLLVEVCAAAARPVLPASTAAAAISPSRVMAIMTLPSHGIGSASTSPRCTEERMQGARVPAEPYGVSEPSKGLVLLWI